jgi:hypothetical protein
VSVTDLDPRSVASPDGSLPALVRRRLSGGWHVDPWGLDSDLVAALGSIPLAGSAVRVEGAGRVPDGPALVVHDRALLGCGSLALVVGLGVALRRPVRFVGVPDLALANALARPLGGVQGHPADLRGLLRQGELVAVPCDGDGGVPPDALEAARVVGAPVLPVGVQPPAPLRRTRVVVGEPSATRRRGRPRPVDQVQAAVRAALAPDR